MTELDLLLRALACPTRLRILAILIQYWERDPQARLPDRTLRPTRLAGALGVSRATVTQHLKVLLRMRLVRFWKLRTAKYYTLCRPRKGSVRWRLLDRLSNELPRDLGPVPSGRGARDGLRPTRPALHSGAWGGPIENVWSALTTFSHFRRIRMLEFLRKAGRAGAEEIADAVDIHPSTARYHIRKLVRRHMLTASGGFAFARPGPTPLHRFIFSLVEIEVARLDPDRLRGRPRAWPRRFAERA